MKIPTPDIQSQLKRFAMLLLVSPLDVHVLDFTTFLDALAQMVSALLQSCSNSDQVILNYSPLLQWSHIAFLDPSEHIILNALVQPLLLRARSQLELIWISILA